jgi:hypothetical protein
MPLELGIFLGAERYGVGVQKRKSCLILEHDPYRYQKFCSDIAGQDIRAHGNTVARAITLVRDWLRAARPNPRMPGGNTIAQRYIRFRGDFPGMCAEQGVDRGSPLFLDYRTLVAGWLAENTG